MAISKKFAGIFAEILSSFLGIELENETVPATSKSRKAGTEGFYHAQIFRGFLISLYLVPAPLVSMIAGRDETKTVFPSKPSKKTKGAGTEYGVVLLRASKSRIWVTGKPPLVIYEMQVKKTRETEGSIVNLTTRLTKFYMNI